jgi:hypothetical protein
VWKLYQNTFGFDEVFRALVRSSAGALPKFCEFLQRADSQVPLVYRDSVLLGYPRHYLRVVDLPTIDSAVDEVSEALSMHVAPSAVLIVVLPIGVKVLLGLRNPTCSWTSTVSPSLPNFTISHCVNSLLCYRLIKRPKSILQDSPKI